ncbi:MAG: hypothetical protein KDN19_22090, partial [Verrucomicrobiae bacterium]|nr:hypothetical protein [Verrucomicrobiae bacterium]
HTWEAELPEGAWVLIELWREGGGEFSPQFLLPFGGERDWFLTFSENRLTRSGSPGAEGDWVGLSVRAEDDESALRNLKSEIPAGGIAVYAGFMDAADFSALRGANIVSLVVGKLPDFSVAKEGKVRGLRVLNDVAEYTGLDGCDALEYFEAPYSGEFPITTLSKLESLTTVVGKGDVNLSALSNAEAPFPKLRHLSLGDVEFEEVGSLPDFLGKLPNLQSLSLPDFVEMDVTGIARCPQLTAVELGNDCLDNGAQGIAALGSLSIALLNPHYTATEISGLSEKGAFAKVRVLGVSQPVSADQVPQLRELRLTGDQASFPPSGLSSFPKLPALEIEFATEADLAALAQAGPSLAALKSLTLTAPKVTDLTPLAALPAMQSLVVSDQLVTFEEKLTRIDLGGCQALKGVELVRLQNLETVELGAATPHAIAIRACTQLATVKIAGTNSLEEVVIDKAGKLGSADALTGGASIKVKRVTK